MSGNRGQSSEGIKNFGYFVLGLAFLGLMLLVVIGFLYGLVWLVDKLYPLAQAFAVIGSVLLFFMLLPSAIFRSSRRTCGKGTVYVSYVWGAALWMWATLVLYNLWGVFGLFLGLVLIGIGSVPMACIALLFSGEFRMLGEMILSVVLVFGVRYLGFWIISKGEQEAAPSHAAETLAAEVAMTTPLQPYRWGKVFAILSALFCVAALFLGPFIAGKGETYLGISTFLIGALLGVQAWGLYRKRKFGLTAFYVMCILIGLQLVLSSVDFGWNQGFVEDGRDWFNPLLYWGSLPYFLKRRVEFA